MEAEIQGRISDLHTLLKEYIVEIPIIQRDYAQGRKDKKELREKFLNSLLDAIENENEIKLDFIYGSVVNGNFQPLDGQQRLTTLYLLYWYAAFRGDKLSSETKHLLSRFTYETRITSREFCHSLINEVLDLSVEMSLKESIINSNWFYLSWLNDPTIDSMLRTIDHIDEKFKHLQNFWEKLNKSSSAISFYFVELERLGLTDDLYIKMNARGKQLTPFENFKAGLQKVINDNNWDENRGLKDTFGIKIDNDWTDYFWSHFNKNNTIDISLLRFISAVNMINNSRDRSLNVKDERAKYINLLQEKPNSIKPENFTASGYKFLYSCFELYMYQVVLMKYLERQVSFPMWRHKANTSILSEVVYNENTNSTVNKESASYTQKVLLFAEILFFQKVIDNNEDAYSDWMRVIRNIVSRADIDREGSRPDIIRSPQSFDGAINLINELAAGCQNIYEHLASNPEIKSQFAKAQVIEEIHKAKLINRDEKNKELLFQAEDNELLRGRIDFLFYVMDYDKKEDNFNAELFEKITTVFNNYFHNEKCLNNDLRRAFLTISVNNEYKFYNYWWSFWHIAKSTKRRLFDKFRELEYYLDSEYKEYFKNLVLMLLSSNLEEISSEFAPPNDFPNWKLKLIKDKSILDQQCKTNYIAISESGDSCYLLKSKRPRKIEGSIKIE